MNYTNALKFITASSTILLLSAGNPELFSHIQHSLKPTPEPSHREEKHECCSAASQPAVVSSQSTAPLVSLSTPKKIIYPEKTIEGIVYEHVLQPKKHTSATGDPLPYQYIRGMYRKKGEQHWNTFLLYFRNPNTHYKTIEVITNNWRIEDGRTEWPQHEMPDELPDLIASENPLLPLRMYHHCPLPCARKEHEWIIIPELEKHAREPYVKNARQTLNLICSLCDNK